MRMFFVAIFVVLFSTNSNASDNAVYVDPLYFKDWRLVVAQLESEGISSQEFFDKEVEKLCYDFRVNASKYSVNRCKYRVVKNKVLYSRNKKSCEVLSVAEYPDSVLNGKVFELKNIKNSNLKLNTSFNKKDEIITVRSEPISYPELQLLRNGHFNKCMLNNGWNDPEDWKLGRE